MKDYLPILEWISGQQREMESLLEQWASINSGSDNIAGLSRMADTMTTSLLLLGTEVQRLSLPPRQMIDSSGELFSSPLGDALRLRKHPNAPCQVFLGGHLDTVFASDSPFQKVDRIDAHTLKGPGVADMKGGLVVLFKALQALERSPWAGEIGWEVLINPDEEIGSPGSEFLLVESAHRNDIGLIFEPTYADGSFVSARKGSTNYSVVARGRSAHAGRDFHQGRNAITHLSRFLIDVEALSDTSKGITVNVGHIAGGGPANIVPDLAIANINVRGTEAKDIDAIKQAIQQLITEGNQNEGLSLVLHQGSSNPPKPFDDAIKFLFQALQQCAEPLGLDIKYKPSGGACDGCRLYANGLPNIDTLGVVGGSIHTHDEYMRLDSLTQRAQLTALFLMRLAAGEIKLISEENSHA